MLSNFYRFTAKIREINHRYSKPHIEMSRAVKMSLLFLRIYLLVLVILILYKFILMLK